MDSAVLKVKPSWLISAVENGNFCFAQSGNYHVAAIA